MIFNRKDYDLKICFIDTLGLCYDGSTVFKRGLGGSESAMIFMARELAKIGFEVEVFNDCETDDCAPGEYDGVLYRPLQEVETAEGNYDIMIGSRSTAAFAPSDQLSRYKTHTDRLPDFDNIQIRSKYKVLWMHDTFCDGDDVIEQYCLEGKINKIFTLSDWHTTYVSTCNHGRQRIAEIGRAHV